MSLFKQKIDFHQFLADLIGYQYNFLENNFDKLVVLADEFNVLTEQDKKELLDKTHELIIANIYIGCNQHFHRELSDEKIGRVVGAVYGQYLTESKSIPEAMAKIKVSNIIKLLDLSAKAEDDIQERQKKFKNDFDRQIFSLCSGFGKYYAGENIKSQNWEGKKFAAFKLANALVKTDIIGQSLKNYSIIF